MLYSLYQNNPKAMLNIKSLVLGCLFLLPFLSHAQVIDFVDVRLRVTEKVAHQTQPLPGARLNISNLGNEQVLTNEDGEYLFSYPIRNKVDPEISIALISDEHKILKPLDGKLELDPARNEIDIEVMVINVTKESPAFRQRIRDLEKRISGLKSKNALTRRQLQALNQALVDTILYFEADRERLESEMSQLSQEVTQLTSLTEQQQSEIEARKKEVEVQKAKMELLQEKVDKLTLDLELALEQKYLRQNEYFKDISENLTEYVQRLKDLKDLLPYIKDYFKGPDYVQVYNDNLNSYNDAFSVLNTQHQSYLEGVNRYWENEELEKELENIFTYLLSGLHLRQVYPLVQELNNEIRKNRPRKAEKLAESHREDLGINTKKLEKDVNRILVQLRNSL